MIMAVASSTTVKSAFVVGFSGATGAELVKELVKSKIFERVVLVGRRKVDYDNPELQNLEQREIDMEKLEELKDVFVGFHTGFCCLGTTRRAAGSAEAFRHVDYDYVHQIAVNCKEGGTKHFHLVSSAGANKDSMLLYGRTKGQIEEAVSNLMFERCSIYRPKLLERGDNMRMAEKAIACLLKPISYMKPEILTTSCNLLAKAMINNCQIEGKNGTEILYNDDIYKLGGYYESKKAAGEPSN